MAYVDLTTYTADLNGVAVTEVTGTSDGVMFVNTGKEILVVRNTDAASHTYTIKTQAANVTAFGAAYSDQSCTVAANGFEAHHLIEPSVFNNSAGKVEVDLESGEEEHLEISVIKAVNI